MAHLKRRPPLFWIIVVAVFLVVIKILHLNHYSSTVTLYAAKFEPSFSSKLSHEIVADSESENVDDFESVDFDYYEEDQQCPSSSHGVEGNKPLSSDITMLDIYEHLVFNDSRQFGNWQQFWDIKIDNSRFTDSNKLNVFLIPHSHNDPGWLKTFEQYYKISVKHILDLMLENLDKDENMKFIWAEMSFFSLWWDELSTEKRLLLKKIVERKQLEFVTGGWVMPDEANSHYYSILIQLIEGNLWLKQHLNYVPRNGWSIDPFGLSPTMAYILKRSGFKNMLIQRTHYLVKQYLGNRQELEFFWRQNWDTSGSTDMMTHMMPFSSYTTPAGCGSDQLTCRTFDFKEKSSNYYSVIPTTERNVEWRSTKLVEQYKKKGMLFKTNNVLVPLGNDFAWATELEWANMTINYGNISDHVNQGNNNFYTQMRYGTLDDYFSTIRSDFKAKNMNVSTLSGDFFTYADRDHHYWSGYYTSRPFHKALDRKLISNLRSAHIIYSFLNAELSKRSGDISQFPFMKRLFGHLRRARRNLSLFQHHDGVTGTSRDHVMKDYAENSYVMQISTQILTQIKNENIITKLKAQQDTDSFDPEAFRLEFRPIFAKVPIYSLPTLETIPLSPASPKAIVTVYNSLATSRTTLVTLKVAIPDEDGTVQVKNQKRQIVDSELFPFFEKNHTISKSVFLLHFLAKQKAISIHNFVISYSKEIKSGSRDELTKILLIGPQSSKLNLQHSRFDISQENDLENISISNRFLELNFNSSGFLSSIILNGNTQKLKIGMFTYGTKAENGAQSGLYLFLPDGPAKLLEIKKESDIKVVKGRLQSYVEVSLPIIQHRTTIYNHSGIESQAIEIRNTIDISRKRDFELMMRIESGVTSGNISFTDLNAFQMIERKRFKSMPLQGHYYPMPSASYIEDPYLRMTILGGQPVGTASLESGQIDVVMDRILRKDDQRGVGQGSGKSIENINTFRILLETSDCQDGLVERVPMLSLTANLLRNDLLHPLHVFRGILSESTNHILSDGDELVNLTADYNPNVNIPCDVEFIDAIPMATFPETLDDINYNPLAETAILLHRAGFDSRFRPNPKVFQYQSSKMTLGQLSLNDLFPNLLKPNVTQMSLSLMQELKNLLSKDTLSLDPMEIYAYHAQF